MILTTCAGFDTRDLVTYLWRITSFEGHGVGIVELQDEEDMTVQGLCTREVCQNYLSK